MSTIIAIFNGLLYRPLFNGLIFLYNTLPGHDFGIAIIALTIIIRLLFYPLFQKQMKAQKEMALIQPKIKEVQKKYKNEKEKQAQAVMDLYKEHKVNPFSGCLPMLIQLPILIAFFQVLRTGLDPSRLSGLYWFVKNPEVINPMFLGLIDLAKSNYVLAVLAGAAQFIQSKMTLPAAGPQKGQGTDFAGLMSTQMIYFMPVLTIMIAWQLPAGLPLYWLVLTIFGIIQQYFINRNKELPARNAAHSVAGGGIKGQDEKSA